MRASVVVATYNRKEPLAKLLASLANQTVRDFEVIVVDDGSRDDPSDVTAPYANVTLIGQANTGVAIARQRGVERAKGRIVVFLDDDMLVREDFLAAHLELHDGHDDRVVMGQLLPDEKLGDMPLFERFHAHQLDKNANAYTAAGTFSGHDVYTGNLSLPRELFLRVGGFDPAFHIEDVELGVRLEKAGAEFVFSTRGASVHASDHSSLEKWLARCVRDGRDWVRLIRKHPSMDKANPWRFVAGTNPLSRPFLVATIVFPKAAPSLTKLVFRGAERADKLGLDRAAVAAMTLVYGIQYFQGVREETGTLRDAIGDYRAYRKRSREQQRA